MRVLLLHPDDSHEPGPWSAEGWDLVVNLGRSALFSQEKTGSKGPVLQVDSYRRGLLDAKHVRQILCAGRGHLIDHEGIDWWELTSVAIVQQAFTVMLLQRLSAEIPASAELWSTRPDWSSCALAHLLDVPVQNFRRARWTRGASRAMHYAQLLHRFSPAQLKQIFFDKYDADYRWRSRLAASKNRCPEPVVLIPSAYSNVSRMAAAYAAMLPQQPFLLVATRWSAYNFSPLPNIQVRDLATYRGADVKSSEPASLIERWTVLKSQLHSCEALRLLSESGVLDQFSKFFQSGPVVRDAWRRVLESEPVSGVLCGDDSNYYTRLPVLLAAKRNISTVDFHHGALDGFYLFKDAASDLYLAKNEMEANYLLSICEFPADKVVIAPPSVPHAPPLRSQRTGRDGCIVLFSEPYELTGMRAEDVYRELLPRLWLLARDNGRNLVVKLHPFESRSQRRRVLKQVLPEEASRHIELVEGPLTAELFRRTWFGITIESTAAIDSMQNGICCFLCRWLTLLPYGYAEQYARFGMGESLHNPEEINEIPRRLDRFYSRPASQRSVHATDPALLQQWLTSGLNSAPRARSAS